MKRLLYSLSGLGLISILIMGALVSSSHADDKCRPKSPVRGTWALSEVGYVIPGIPGPLTEVGIINVDECGSVTGHAVFDASDSSGGADYDIDGACVMRKSGGEMDCTLSAPDLGLFKVGRYCVMTGKNDGGCFDKWHCISSNPKAEPGVVVLGTFERQQAGTCK